MTVLSAPSTIAIPVTFMFHSFFSSLARSRCFSLFAFLQIYPMVSRNINVHYSASSHFCFWTSLGLVVWPYYNSHYCYSFENFHTSVSWWFFTGVWVVTSLLVSRTLLSILPNLCNAVVWMVSTCPIITKSSSRFSNPLGIVQSGIFSFKK